MSRTVGAIKAFQDDIAKIEVMAGLGMRLDDIAAVLGLSSRALDMRIQKNPEIKNAIEKGRALARKSIHETAYKLASSGKVPAMTMFWLKCQAGWHEKATEILVSGNVEIEHSVKQEIEHRTQRLLQIISDKK